MSMSRSAESPFSRRTIFWGTIASLLSAAGFVLLSTYAPDFRLGQQGGTSALSKSGTGFAGLVEFMTLLDDEPETARSIDELYGDELVVVTISPRSAPEALKEILNARSGLTTLFVLPKWRTVPYFGREDWEMETGRLPAEDIDQWLARFMEVRAGRDKVDVHRLEVYGNAFTAPAPPDLQWAVSENAVISAGGNRAVLIEAEEEPFFVLTDPDLLDNAALKDPARAAAAIGLINMLRPNGDPVIFDLTLHGASRKHNLMKLLLEPPFLALTLAILVASALALMHGIGRFGPPQADTRAIPLGKRALVETTARLMGRAGRLNRLGDRYATLIRQRAGTILGAPHDLRDESLDHWLAARDRDSNEDYAALSSAVRKTGNEADLTTAARRLHQWIKRSFRERR